jgi:hypothetical protein
MPGGCYHCCRRHPPSPPAAPFLSPPPRHHSGFKWLKLAKKFSKQVSADNHIISVSGHGRQFDKLLPA